MVAWCFVALILTSSGTQSEVFDYQTREDCEARRAKIMEFLLTESEVRAMYVGACTRLELLPKT